MKRNAVENLWLRCLRRLASLPRVAILFSISLYQRGISPLLGPNCRFFPTCSEYARQAVTGHGAARGMFLALRRISRCHPFHPGGYDPVPDSKVRDLVLRGNEARH